MRYVRSLSLRGKGVILWPVSQGLDKPIIPHYIIGMTYVLHQWNVLQALMLNALQRLASLGEQRLVLYAVVFVLVFSLFPELRKIPKALVGLVRRAIKGAAWLYREAAWQLELMALPGKYVGNVSVLRRDRRAGWLGRWLNF